MEGGSSRRGAVEKVGNKNKASAPFGHTTSTLIQNGGTSGAVGSNFPARRTWLERHGGMAHRLASSDRHEWSGVLTEYDQVGETAG